MVAAVVVAMVRVMNNVIVLATQTVSCIASLHQRLIMCGTVVDSTRLPYVL